MQKLFKDNLSSFSSHHIVIASTVLLLYPLAVVQMEDQVFKGRLPYKNGRLSLRDDADDAEMALSESDSNSSSRSSELDEKCSITAV